MTSIDNLVLEIENATNTIMSFEKKINQLKIEIRKKEKHLWNSCKHETWVFCTACTFDDPCKWYCSKCKLWKDKRLYE